MMKQHERVADQEPSYPNRSKGTFPFTLHEVVWYVDFGYIMMGKVFSSRITVRLEAFIV